MKIIISRKGFDSGYGGVPSPVLPDGRIVSLPIPSSAGTIASKVNADELCLGNVIADLTSGRLGGNTLVHVDPDIEKSTLSRVKGWRPVFGQVGAAQSHLANQGVGVGDIFLYFGWFRPVEMFEGHWRYVRHVESFHGLFGWFRVSDVIDVDGVGTHSIPDWLLDHPHIKYAERFKGQSNTLYIAANEFGLGNSAISLTGAGAFRRWSQSLKLSAEGQLKSVWSVPTWLEPTQGRPALTYHRHLSRWSRFGERLYLATVAKGQEFVLDTAYYPEAVPWACKLIEDHA